jgi:putative ABC transport system permease protein
MQAYLNNSMDIKNSFVTASRALAKNKMRSSLTSIGIIIGVSSVIIMIGIGNSAQVVIRERIISFGTNSMRLYSERKPITQTDLDNMKKSYQQIKHITPVTIFNPQIKFRNISGKTLLLGVNNEYFQIMNRTVKNGRFFTDDEMSMSSKVVIIGSKIKHNLFGQLDPLDEQIVMNGIPLKVIGVLEEAGQAFSGFDFDDMMLIPYTTSNTRIWNRNDFNEIYVAAQSEQTVDETAEILRKYFRQKHNLIDSHPDDFEIISSKDKLKMATDVSNATAILLAGIASISLFVGGVGIMNIMLVSVTERTREIGIRMAIGAKKRDIMLQFLIEAVTLSVSGGFIGILFGITVYYSAITILKWPFLFSPSSIFISVFFAAAVGIFFGYYPSKKASQLKPIDALKYE